LDKEVKAPSKVVLDQNSRSQCAAVDEEDDGNGEICYHKALDMLLCFRHLNLGGDKNEGSKDHQKPLVFDEPL
jgi:hypothetical protein